MADGHYSYNINNLNILWNIFCGIVACHAGICNVTGTEIYAMASLGLVILKVISVIPDVLKSNTLEYICRHEFINEKVR